jgi:cytidylate kinase
MEFAWKIHSIGEIWRERWRSHHSDDVPFEEFWRNRPLEEQMQVNARMREIVERGRVVGESRYVHYLADLPALLVFVYADLETRVKRASKVDYYREMSPEQARGLLITRESDEILIGKRLYGKDYDYRDSKYYHLVLNSGALSPDEEISAVKGLMEDLPCQ